MELRTRMKMPYGDQESEVGDEEVSQNQPTTLKMQSSELALAQKRAQRVQRSKRSREDQDGDGDDEKATDEVLQRKLKTTTDEREIKRIKRLLRNRVSAQQARERKKAYVSDLERQLVEKDELIMQLQHEVSAARKDNGTLRRLLLTMRTGQSTMGNEDSVSEPAEQVSVDEDELDNVVPNVEPSPPRDPSCTLICTGSDGEAPFKHKGVHWGSSIHDAIHMDDWDDLVVPDLY